jgi:hypothetical protein
VSAWTDADLYAALDRFKHGEDGMYNGAGPEALVRGMEALAVFLESPAVSADAREYAGYALDEAQMRCLIMMDAMVADAKERRDAKAVREMTRLAEVLAAGARQLERFVESARGRFETAEELYAYLDRYRSGRREPRPTRTAP